MEFEEIYVIFKTEWKEPKTGKPIFIAHNCLFDGNVRKELAERCPQYVGFTETFQKAQAIIGKKGTVRTSWKTLEAYLYVMRILILNNQEKTMVNTAPSTDTRH